LQVDLANDKYYSLSAFIVHDTVYNVVGPGTKHGYAIIQDVEAHTGGDAALASALWSRPSTTYCFGDCRFDPSRQLLFRGNEVTPVPNRLSFLLTELVAANGALVTKEALAASVWPHEAVSDGNLAQHVYMLRRLLGERARDHSYILSVSGGGYRFALPVVEAIREEVARVDLATPADSLLRSGVEPFRNYCQGSFFLEQRTAPAVRRAIECFEAALAADPNYLPALIGVARAHALLAEYWHVAPSLSYPLAKHAIARALEIDPNCAIAHAVYSGILCFCDWDWKRAQDEIALAIRLNPGSTFVRNNAAWLYVCAGRYQDALVEAHSALTMEPASLPMQLLVARVLVHSREYPKAIALMSNLLETDPAFYIARRYRAQAYLLGGDPEKALRDLELLPQERSEDPSFRLPMLGRACADLGDRERARRTFNALRSIARTEYVVSWNLAIVAAGLGYLDEAMSYLQTAYDRREVTLPFLKSLRWFEPISRGEPFRELLRKVGPYSSSSVNRKPSLFTRGKV
jgi:DNA-binding winged helix-turn-helix (wHTH) protein/tetratricopeptide (TPR) repeat protein